MPLAIVLLLPLPLFAGTGEKSWRSPPGRGAERLLILLIVTTLAALGVTSHGPVMDAGTAAATPVVYVQGRSPLELQGALVVHNKQCRNCTASAVKVVPRPRLDGVATRLTHDQLITAGAPGRGQHAAYGKNSPGRGERGRRVLRPPSGEPAAGCAPVRRGQYAQNDGARRKAGAHLAPVLGAVLAPE